ncbi:MAG: SPFH domain-containing protein [bacterium]|nr:SPFH domain-containing protein [bacterium]
MVEEKEIQPMSGWGMLCLGILVLLVTAYVFYLGITQLKEYNSPWLFIASFFVLGVGILILVGLYILQPNQAGALVLFGHYQGTVKKNGFLWRNPFTSVKNISLRSRNLNGNRLKVNDQSGNPIEIAAVVVWKVTNTAHALFEVDDYEDYVEIQSEAAVRHLAGKYPYDSEDEEVSLRQGTDGVNDLLMAELQDRLAKAGVRVEEARISHLAYAPEIAGAMLRRQQAQAVIAARKRIVEGAVGMVDMALKELGEKQVVELDEERKASMVSNLLVVLCSEENAQPVVNTGTLYN